MIPLAAFEEIIDASGTAARIEAMLPLGVRARQLPVRTLLPGMLLVLADHRPAHLTRVHQALTALPEDDQRRLCMQVSSDDIAARRVIAGKRDTGVWDRRVPSATVWIRCHLICHWLRILFDQTGYKELAPA